MSSEISQSRPVKRSLTLHGHRTSVSLEAPFWAALGELAAVSGLSVNALAAQIDAARSPPASLASALRQHILAAMTDGDASQPTPKPAVAASVIEALSNVSTATLTTALFKRGLRNQTVQGVRRLSPGATMAGPAMTLRYIPAREDLNPISVFENPEHPQRVAIERCPSGAVLVIDSRGDPRAASAGGILVTRLMVRGAAGIVTDGGFRDADEIATLAIPSYHQRPSAPTNLTRHQAIDVDVPIGCGDAPVWPGDIVVGDGDGVVIVPSGIAEDVAAEATEMTLFETFVTERVRRGASLRGLYPPTDPHTRDAFAAWRASRKTT